MFNKTEQDERQWLAQIIEELFRHVAKHEDGVHPLDPESSALSSGVLITSAHLAKGLEFERVVVPHVSDRYRQKYALYCLHTRAA